MIATVSMVSTSEKSSPAEHPPIKAILFDMGGVLVELGALEELLGLGAGAAEDFWPSWLASEAVRSYEKGLTDTKTFAEGLVSEFALALTADEFTERFRQFPRGLFPGAVDLVDSVSSDLVTGVLSNTNELHWEHQKDAGVIQGLCDRSYLSYQLQMVKPDRELFDYVIADLGFAAEQILFVDDNQINVDGALAAGLKAAVAKGPAETASVLARHSLTSA